MNQLRSLLLLSRKAAKPSQCTVEWYHPMSGPEAVTRTRIANSLSELGGQCFHNCIETISKSSGVPCTYIREFFWGQPVARHSKYKRIIEVAERYLSTHKRKRIATEHQASLLYKGQIVDTRQLMEGIPYMYECSTDRSFVQAIEMVESRIRIHGEHSCLKKRAEDLSSQRAWMKRMRPFIATKS